MLAQPFFAAFLALLAFAAALPAQKYNGPRPPKPDVLYLLHASKLIETEMTEAREEKRKDDNVYVVDGSVHVTNGGFNPSLTILATAYWASHHMVKQQGRVKA